MIQVWILCVYCEYVTNTLCLHCRCHRYTLNIILIIRYYSWHVSMRQIVSDFNKISQGTLKQERVFPRDFADSLKVKPKF